MDHLRAAEWSHRDAMNDRAKSRKLRPASFSCLSIDSGSPVAMSKTSPFFAAWRSADRKLSASALVRKVLDFCLPSTFQRTS